MPDFYTTLLHKKMVIDGDSIDTTDTAATGTAKDNMLDGNLDTIWQPNATGDKSIIIDTGVTDNYVDAFGLWIADYDTDYNSTTIRLYSSTDGSTWGTPDHSGFMGSNRPLLVINLAAAVEDQRYFKINWPSLGDQIEVGHVFLFRKRALGVSPEYPLVADPEYFNLSSALKSGRNLIMPLAGINIYQIERLFRLTDSTDITMMENILAECRGQRYLFVYKENSTYYLCRLIADRQRMPEERYNYSEIMLRFQTLPYIEDGENY